MLRGAELETWNGAHKDPGQATASSETREPGGDIASTVRMIGAGTVIVLPSTSPNQDDFPVG